MSQLHKHFTSDQVKELLERYLRNEIERKHLQEILGIKERRFFSLVRQYKENPHHFTIQYHRASPLRISKDLEQHILKELSIEKEIIQNKEIPLKSYNYSYIKDRLKDQYRQKVTLPTIIDRAKKHDFYLKRPQRTPHDREVLTRYVGELIQHDASYHLWAPASEEKWYLITSLDDHSRLLLYATLMKTETSWAHILALQTLTLQSKGKMERPYGWLQDRLVRTCVREDVTEINQTQRVLNHELYRYNHQQIHSITQEIPYLRFQKALKEDRSLFRTFQIKPPYQSTKDIFCLRIDRTIDSYRRISINT